MLILILILILPLIYFMLQLVMGILQLGFISVYLSEPLTRSLTCAASCHVFTSQITDVFGLSIPKHHGSFKLIYVSYII